MPYTSTRRAKRSRPSTWTNSTRDTASSGSASETDKASVLRSRLSPSKKNTRMVIAEAPITSPTTIRAMIAEVRASTRRLYNPMAMSAPSATPANTSEASHGAPTAAFRLSRSPACWISPATCTAAHSRAKSTAARISAHRSTCWPNSCTDDLDTRQRRRSGGGVLCRDSLWEFTGFRMGVAVGGPESLDFSTLSASLAATL